MSDPLLAAWARRLRGKVRHQREVDDAIRKLSVERNHLRLERENLAQAVRHCLDGELVRLAKTKGDSETFMARTEVCMTPLVEASGKCGMVEVMAAAFKVLVRELTDKIEEGLRMRMSAG
jgi:hypothetical protein